MSYPAVDGVDYMADEQEMEDFGNEVADENYVRDGEVGLDEYNMLTRVSDTSAAQARQGKDIQGIPWDRLSITRDKYRLTRLEEYRNHENVPLSGETMDKECKPVEKGGNYYQFFHNTRLVKPTILHFQLRNLIWASSKHDVYLMSSDSVMHWSSLSGNLSEILNFSGHVAPSEKHQGSLLEGFTQTKISTLAVKDNFLVAGGFQGELTCKHTSMSPDRRLIAVVGDNTEGLLVDSNSGKTVATVVGHLDYSFASAWHPDGRTFATGNQDKTCRVWDVRKLSSPTAILKGNLCAVRSIRFSSDGQFMVVAEAADFVHVYSTKSDYKKRQEIDFFGEISGVSLSPDDESLYIGIWDPTKASLLQYNRRHTHGLQ